MLNRFRAVVARLATSGFSRERGEVDSLRFVTDERAVPVAGITKGF
jgi:hypothetical protein